MFVENDVNLNALGELGFGAGKGIKDLIYITIGTGIGAGVVVGGQLYRGHNQAAGEVGYLPPGIQFFNQRYDQFGALESLAFGTGIAERGRQRLHAEGRYLNGHDFGAEGVFSAARLGDTWPQNVIDATADYLALAVASFASVLNPEMIILGGGVARSADLLIEPILKRIEGVTPFIPRLVASSLDNKATVLVAVILVLNQIMNYSVVNPHS